MTTYGHILPGAASIAHWAKKVESLTSKARHRLRVLDWHRVHNQNISLTARHFSLTRYTVREWQKRFKQRGIVGLNDLSRRPKRLRKPTTDYRIITEAIKLRKQYPAWSKYKIRALLVKQKMIVSASTVGRMLKRRGLIDQRISRKRRRSALYPKARYPRGLKISRPGDLIQMDTKYINLIGGKRIYQFTAIDVLTKRRALRYYSSLSSRNGADFLSWCFKRFPFLIRAVQTDNGAEFLKEFIRSCQKKNLLHYFIVPRTPKQNTYVEVSHGADEREFYQQGMICDDLKNMRVKLEKWEDVWNNIRPHEALNYLTPQEYFKKWQRGRLPTKDVITLQT